MRAFESSAGYGCGDGGVGEELERWFCDEAAADEESFSGRGLVWGFGELEGEESLGHLETVQLVTDWSKKEIQNLMADAIEASIVL